jgi:presenilin-like A22 family membrane protease
MKHSIKVTLILITLFFVAQIIGIAVTGFYAPREIQIEIGEEDNQTWINYTTYDLPFWMNPPPESNDPGMKLFSIVIAIALVVVIMLVLMKIRAEFFLRSWFFIVISLAMAITLNMILILFSVKDPQWLALLFAIPLAYIKLFRRGVYSHNFTELLIYPGIAAIFVPLMNLWTTIALLVIISIYDVYAVWHAGFMQKMAKYQMEKLKFFAGFFVPYVGKKERELINRSIKNNKSTKDKNVKVNIAILGGGDVVFPIVLSGVVLHIWGLIPALIIAIGATIALSVLFYYSEKGKYYPAMPFISAGCFAALIVAYFFRF